MDDIFSNITNTVLYSDPSATRIKFFTRARTAQLIKSKKYRFSESEQHIISDCKKKRLVHMGTIAAVTGTVAIVGVALSARKTLILEYAALIGGLMMYEEMTEEYGTCLFGLCQLPKSDLASEIRYKLFQEIPKSPSATFLRAMGYDEKHIEEPVTDPIIPLDAAKKVTIQQNVASSDLQCMQLLNRMRRYFPIGNPSFTTYDNIIKISFSSENEQIDGSSYHVEGNLKDVVTMIRRVSQVLNSTPALANSIISGTIYQHGEIYSGEVISLHKEGIEKKGNSTKVNERKKRKEEEERERKRVEDEHRLEAIREIIKKQEREEKEKQREQTYHHSRLSQYDENEDDYHGTAIAPHDEDHNDYHGTAIAPQEEKERNDYHGTAIAPYSKEQNDYHGTAIAPHDEERNDYHGTAIAPQEEKERNDYHGTAIAPQDEKEDEFEQIIIQDKPTDFSEYFSKPNEWYADNDTTTNTTQSQQGHRYIPYSERHHNELHKRPDQHVTWDEIRRKY